MKYFQLLLWGLGSLFLAAEAGDVAGEKLLSSDSHEEAIYEGIECFECPLPFGIFPDPTDCALYYDCIDGIAVPKKCDFLTHFDVFKRECISISEAICVKDITNTTATPSVTATETTKIDITTASIPTKPIVTEVPETSTTEEEITASTTETNITTEEEIIESTTEAIIGTEKITTESTAEVNSTTKFRPTGPPDHTCEEDDVDCIVTETGDVQDWFICPRDMGFFTHPSSGRLFIFCMNWIPSVRRCGQDLVFSKDHGKCI